MIYGEPRCSQAEQEIDILKGGGGEFFVDNLLVRVHFIIEMIRWTGLVPWGLEFPLPGSLTSSFLRKL